MLSSPEISSSCVSSTKSNAVVPWQASTTIKIMIMLVFWAPILEFFFQFFGVESQLYSFDCPVMEILLPCLFAWTGYDCKACHSMQSSNWTFMFLFWCQFYISPLSLSSPSLFDKITLYRGLDQFHTYAIFSNKLYAVQNAVVSIFLANWLAQITLLEWLIFLSQF